MLQTLQQSHKPFAQLSSSDVQQACKNRPLKAHPYYVLMHYYSPPVDTEELHSLMREIGSLTEDNKITNITPTMYEVAIGFDQACVAIANAPAIADASEELQATSLEDHITQHINAPQIYDPALVQNHNVFFYTEALKIPAGSAKQAKSTLNIMMHIAQDYLDLKHALLFSTAQPVDILNCTPEQARAKLREPVAYMQTKNPVQEESEGYERPRG